MSLPNNRYYRGELEYHSTAECGHVATPGRSTCHPLDIEEVDVTKVCRNRPRRSNTGRLE
jgi:hypothetical protein